MNIVNILLAVFASGLFISFLINQWLERVFQEGNTVYISKKFPIKEFVGIPAMVRFKGDNGVSVKIVDNNYFDIIKKYQTTINNSISSISLYAEKEYLSEIIKHFNLSADMMYFTTKPPKQIKNKRKGSLKMPRIHRFLLHTALVYLIWKAVLNVENIINYIVTLLG